MKKHYKVTSIPRFSFFIVLCTVLILAAAFLIIGAFRADAGVDTDSAYAYEEVTVDKGDTLWSIAEDQYGSSVDPREAVYAIRSANDMKDASIHEGQILRIPNEI